MTSKLIFFVVVRNISYFPYWPSVFGSQQELRSRQPVTAQFEGMHFHPSRALNGQIERCPHMSPFLRSERIMDLINFVSNEGLESSLLIGNVLKDRQGVHPKGDTMDGDVQLIVNEHVETRRDYSCL